MKYFLPTVLLFFSINDSVTAFHVFVPHAAVAARRMMAVRSTTTALNLMYPKEFTRAVECASNAGLCKHDELNKLADELEAYQGCFFEENEIDCEKEIMDRHDVVEILRMDAELQLRQDYLKNANLFKADVEEAHNIEDRDELIETMEEMGTD